MTEQFQLQAEQQRKNVAYQMAQDARMTAVEKWFQKYREMGLSDKEAVIAANKAVQISDIKDSENPHFIVHYDNVATTQQQPNVNVNVNVNNITPPYEFGSQIYGHNGPFAIDVESIAIEDSTKKRR